ncbi:hypothetical protein GBAR_LOCUS27439 [Geodia barretti]|uniref:Death domain-containing protein n=1 Tax=Geodia barretti TaxID=519541 RepID=A0AA35TK92_GEOBA|nr:hypothetical protein GBAR_LOCUS27439 [Geodia barretti]
MCQELESDSESKVIVIGTHKDVYEAKKEQEHVTTTNRCLCCKREDSDFDPVETIDKKNLVLERLIPDDSKVYFNKSRAIIFEVNAAVPLEGDKVIASKIRKKVSESAQQRKGTETIPIFWYVLQIVLEEVAQRLGRQVFSISECETVAKVLRIGPDEMKAALRFLDRLNIFFYKENILPGVVFTSSQVPLSCVSELVKKLYSMDKENLSEGCDPIDGMWGEFCDKAQLTLKHLQDKIFQSHYVKDDNGTPVFTAEMFLDLLKRLHIVAPVNDEIAKCSKFFCPALLETVKVDEYFSQKRDYMVTRVFHFSSTYAPRGVFCCTVCFLRSVAGWDIITENDDDTDTVEEEYVIARNKVTFAVKGVRVTFIDKLQFFAVSIAVEDFERYGERLCKQIDFDVQEAIKDALEKTCSAATKIREPSFLCPLTCKHETLHPATVGDKFNLICTKQPPLIRGTLNEKQKVWHTYQCSGTTSEPDMKVLSNLVMPEVSNIMPLALQLDLEMHEIGKIKCNYPNDVSTQTLRVFCVWRKKDKNYTWEFLIKALKSPAVNNPRLANKVEEWLNEKKA